MATISSPGIGSGLDIRSIVSQLVELEKRPLQQVQKRTQLAALRLSTLAEVKSRVAALDDALAALTRASTYRERTVQSSSPAVSGTAAFTANPAGYTVQVNQLARGQSVQSMALPSDAAVGAGALTIEMGRWSNGVFTTDTSRPPLTIAVSIEETLADVARKINDANGAVTASIVNDGSGSRLVLRSRSTGENEGFRVQVTDADGDVADGNGLSRLSYDPETLGTSTPPIAMQLGQAAQDTLMTIDGIEVRSSSATVSDAIPGVTLTATAITSGDIQVQVGYSNGQARKALQAFVDAYNDLESLLSEALRYDAATRKAGPLQGDSAVVTLQASLRRLLAETGPDGRTLSDIGLQLGRDGRLTLNESRLETALANPEALNGTLNSAEGDGPGIAQKWRSVTQMLLKDDGRLGQKKVAIEAELDRLKKQEDQINEKAIRTEQRLLAQYGRLDTTVSRLNALNAYVSQQISQWNKKDS